MRVVIAGSRNLHPESATISWALEWCGWSPTEVVSGGCRGVDTAAKRWAGENGVPFNQFAAEWKRHGRRAGPLRNEEMARYADAVLLFWDGESSGTRSMRDLAAKYSKPTRVLLLEYVAGALEYRWVWAPGYGPLDRHPDGTRASIIGAPLSVPQPVTKSKPGTAG